MRGCGEDDTGKPTVFLRARGSHGVVDTVCKERGEKGADRQHRTKENIRR